MTTPHEQLNRLIDDLQNNKPVSPQTEAETLTAELVQLAAQFELNPDFDRALMEQFTPPTQNHRRMHTNLLRWVATFVIGIASIIVLFSTVPALRVLAEDILNELFPRDTETSHTISKEDDRYAFNSDNTIRLESISDIPTVLDYEVKIPDIGTLGFTFEQAIITVPRNTIQTYYSQPLPDGRQFWKLNIRQQPLADTVNGIFYFTVAQDTISPEAETTPVSIAGYHGEFVQGDWFTSEPASDKKYFFWNADAPVYRLRWQDDTFLYEIELWTLDENPIDTIIYLAESMMAS